MGRVYGDRSSHLAGQETFIVAALVAAHATAEDGSFRPADVRFFFFLFTNWVEHDLVYPTQDLALTQVRRVMQRLIDDGRAEQRAAGRRPRYRLTDDGLSALVEALVEPGPNQPRRTLETSLFVLCFASLYRPVLTRRLRLETRPPALRRRLSRMLAPRTILAHARSRARDLLADLDERIASGEAMQQALDHAPATDEATRIAAIKSLGAYQLERMRPVSEVFDALPPDVREVELRRGPGLRAKLLFAPLAEVLRHELTVLDGLELDARGNLR